MKANHNVAIINDMDLIETQVPISESGSNFHGSQDSFYVTIQLQTCVKGGQITYKIIVEQN